MCCASRRAHCHKRLRSTDGSDGSPLLSAVLTKGEQLLCCKQRHHLPLLALLLAPQQHLHHALQMSDKLTWLRHRQWADRKLHDMECNLQASVTCCAHSGPAYKLML